MTTKKGWLIGLVVLGAVYFYHTLGIAADPPPKLVFLLLDLSGSVSQQSRDLYLKRAEEILARLNPGDRIVMGAIQDKSAVKGVFAVNEGLPVMNQWVDNKLIYMAQVNEKKKVIRERLGSLLEQRASQATEIMSALVPAQQLFGSFKDYPQKILVIMSDMIEESSRYNFHRRPPGQKDTLQIIAAEKNQKRLADLSGVKVYVVGAGGKSSEDMLKVKEFWLAYFQACGADLNPANYGADLVKFE